MDGIATIIAAISAGLLGLVTAVAAYKKWATEAEMTAQDKFIASMQKTIDVLRDECFRRMQSEAKAIADRDEALAELRSHQFRKEVQEKDGL